MHGAINAVVIVLDADFAWHVIRAVIDRKIVDSQIVSQLGSEESRRRSRMHLAADPAQHRVRGLMVIAV
jgi:hypothetical protein